MTAGPCSTGALEAGEPEIGSAPQALAWVALEQPGPWGPKAFTQSRLDPVTGAAIEAAAAGHSVRPCLIRAPGPHADLPDERTVLVAFTLPGAAWLLEGRVSDPAVLLDMDWPALEDGDREAVRRSLPVLSPSDRSHLLVCTNGTRDLCCAVRGRPVALAVGELNPGRVWEVTHTSGHRFAPTSVLLPSGYLHGRLSPEAAASVLTDADAGLLHLAGLRGRSTWPGPGQVAELAVRSETDERRLGAVTVVDVRPKETDQAPGWVATVQVDGRARWTVDVGTRPAPTPRAESCGKAPKEFDYWVVSLTHG